MVVLQCMWCGSKSACLAYPGGIPSSDFCSFSDLRWGTCWGKQHLHLFTTSNRFCRLSVMNCNVALHASKAWYCFGYVCLCVCVCVCLSSQTLRHCLSEIDVTFKFNKILNIQFNKLICFPTDLESHGKSRN